MLDDLEEWQLVQAVRARFPSEAEHTDTWVKERGFEGPYAWLESFADRTTEAIFAQDSVRVAAHTEFISEWYLRGSDALRQLVDVYYAEPLMWNASQAQKYWAWDYISAPVRSLHEEMWGPPHG
jgi:hypothetical protein